MRLAISDKYWEVSSNQRTLTGLLRFCESYAILSMMSVWWIAPPGLNDERPRINWDIGALTHALMEVHAISHGVTIDDLLYEIGFQYCMKRPDLYWAMKSAKINISDN